MFISSNYQCIDSVCTAMDTVDVLQVVDRFLIGCRCHISLSAVSIQMSFKQICLCLTGFTSLCLDAYVFLCSLVFHCMHVVLL